MATLRTRFDKYFRLRLPKKKKKNAEALYLEYKSVFQIIIYRRTNGAIRELKNNRSECDDEKSGRIRRHNGRIIRRKKEEKNIVI